MQRPTGITVVAILYGVSGGLSLTTSCLSMVVGSWLAASATRAGSMPSLLAHASAYRGALAFWLGLFGAGASLFKLTAAVGLLALQPWAWRLALLGGSLKLATHLVAVIRGEITLAGILGALLNGAILAYLATPTVRRALSGVPDDAATDALETTP